MTIWMLVERCARELTENGISPFTRSDIIKCVQRKNAAYGPNSINPIIQGITDNLHGGAPGAVGKNILHSVGRGLFVLSGEKPEHMKQLVSDPPTQKPKKAVSRKSDSLMPENLTNQISNNSVRRIGGYDFRYICTIEPEREPNGTVLTFMPQARFVNTNSLALNKYGNGPFCRFKISRNLEYPGVYALMEASDIKYIGECVALSSRYNMGYGNISPRNCFVGGQETNCRINNLILQQISAGSKISLWFLNTSNHKSIEPQLRASLSPSWNRS
ncbi:MAG: GIY-YIG nuclease family protein [Anaerolineaceae bacterium]|nr:GIY-YIG nuclease family protein [Anaerolineaceae bacterium]